MATLQEANMKRVQELVAEFQAGRPEGYLAGVHDDIKGSVLGGLIPGGESYVGKAAFMNIMQVMPEYMEVSKFEPKNWRATGDDVLFNVDWTFVWKKTGKEVSTTALVRKVVKDGMICEKYHIVDVEAITGEKAPHDMRPVRRVQELLAEYMAGRAEGYLAGVADDIKADMFNGLVTGADRISDKAGFVAVMPEMAKVMDVSKFEPYNFRALPNNDVMFNVDWRFVYKPTGKEVEATAVVRKVLKEVDGQLMICEKYHLIDAADVVKESPRGVIEGEAEPGLVARVWSQAMHGA